MSGNEFSIDIGKHERDKITGGCRGTSGLCMLEAGAGSTVPEHGRLVAESVENITESSKIDELTDYRHSVSAGTICSPPGVS